MSGWQKQAEQDVWFYEDDSGQQRAWVFLMQTAAHPEPHFQTDPATGEHPTLEEAEAAVQAVVDG